MRAHELPLRVGVVGIGFGQHVHVPAFRSDPRVRVDAVCATSEPRARAVADRLSIGRAFGDWRALVADPALDVIAVSVPPQAQAQIALAAARAGKHLFVEKPLATTAEEASAIVEAAAASGVVGAIDFEFRVVPAWQKARDIIQGGQLGQIRCAFITWRVETMAYRSPGPGWKRGEGGGTLNLFASHSLDSVLWLFGPVRRLASHLQPSTGVEARADLWLELASGPTVSISIAADLPGGSGHRLEVYGDAGSLFLDNRSNDYVAGFELTTANRSQPPVAVELPRPRAGEDGRILAVAEMARRFIDAITVEGTGQVSASLADGLAVQRLLDLARKAHRSHVWSS